MAVISLKPFLKTTSKFEHHKFGLEKENFHISASTTNNNQKFN